RSKRDWSSDVCSSDLCEFPSPPLREVSDRKAILASGVGPSLSCAWVSFPDARWSLCTTVLDRSELQSGAECGCGYLRGGAANERSEERRVGKECRCVR